MKQLTLQMGGYDIQGPEKFQFESSSIGDIVGQALPYVFAFAGIGLLLMIIASGFTIMLAAGDAKKMEMGRTRLTNAIVGFILVFAAFWIVQILGTILGWDSIFNAFGQ